MIKITHEQICMLRRNTSKTMAETWVPSSQNDLLGNIILKCVAFVYAAFVELCEDVILCLFKTPDGLIKNWISNSKTGARAGRQRE